MMPNVLSPPCVSISTSPDFRTSTVGLWPAFTYTKRPEAASRKPKNAVTNLPDSTLLTRKSFSRPATTAGSPRDVSWLMSEARKPDIKSAAGTPLPETSATTSSKRPPPRSMLIVVVTAHFARRLA